MEHPTLEVWPASRTPVELESYSSSNAGRDMRAFSVSTADSAGPSSLRDKSAAAVTEEEEEEEEEEAVRLNGGFVAWSQVFVGFLLAFNGFGYLSAFGLFQAHWTEALQAPAADVALVGSFSLFLLFFLGALSGPLMDRGHFGAVTRTGCCFQVLAIFGTAAAGSYWQLFLAQGLAQGIGYGLLFTPCVTLIAVYFTEGGALAFGVAACGAPVGGVVFSLVYQQVSGLIGAPWTIRVMGIIVLCNAILITVLSRPRSFKQERRGLVALSAFKEPVYALFAVGIFFTLLGVYIAAFYTDTYGRTVLGNSESQSLTLLVILNAAGLPGRLAPAYLAGRFFGPFEMLLPFVLGCSVMFFVWIRITSNGAFYAFVVLYGICSSAVQTLFPSALSSLATDPGKMGQHVGTVFSVGSLACLVGPPLAGMLIDGGKGSYLYAQLYGGISMLLAFAFLSLSRFVLSLRR